MTIPARVFVCVAVTVSCVLPQIWKRLVHQAPVLSDLDAVDANFARSLARLRAREVSPAVRATWAVHVYVWMGLLHSNCLPHATQKEGLSMYA